LNSKYLLPFQREKVRMRVSALTPALSRRQEREIKQGGEML